jgi:glycosyltransferase involved in cell wall biosynthesis
MIHTGNMNPSVSIIIPCYNEQDTIGDLLEAIHSQSYPSNKIEVIIADGLSTDDTRKKITDYQLQNSRSRIKVLDNEKRNIPSALNLAISEASGEYIIRLDAHSIPSDGYLENCVELLQNNKIDNVGGKWKILPRRGGWMARSISIAASHPLGAGGVKYRIGGTPQEVDTVPFGAYKKSLIDEIGGYDESLLSNEDYELNVRIRERGGKVWFDPKIWSYYYARAFFTDLARQYWRYGFWKFRMLLRFPKSFRFRQAAGLFVLSLIILGVFSIRFDIARVLLSLELISYFSLLFGSAIHATIKEKYVPLLAGFPIAVSIMHFSWGCGFLWSILEYPFKRIKSEYQRI